MVDTGTATGPDELFDQILDGYASAGIDLYEHQSEAILEVVSGSHVVLATPTGSGKSLVAEAAHRVALATDRVSFYTAPIKALVSEKFFALCEVFGAADVGMLTGDASVNADAPIICCTAEVLANLSLREGAQADVGLVIMDEFHYYGDPQRGWAWQVPLLELPQAQFVLMSATLGDVTSITEALTEATGREVATIANAERPVPLTFEWSLEPLTDAITELVETRQTPAYLVHFTQAEAVERARALANLAPITGALSKDSKAEITERLKEVRFAAGFGKTLSTLLRRGIGVHHAGMLPRYRRTVEHLAQAGLLTVVCGTDTLGVGINVPIRTVLFTGLAKYDGVRSRVISSREFHQIAGRAGRAGFDTSGLVVVQAPEHIIENTKALAKAGDDAKKRRKVQRKQAPDGAIVWTDETFDKLVSSPPEALRSRMRMNNAMLINLLARPTDAVAVARRLIEGSHEDRGAQLRIARRAVQQARSLVHSEVVLRLETPDEDGRRYVLNPELADDFALNQPLAHFALAALDVLDPDHTRESEHVRATYATEVVSVIESVLEAPMAILIAQRRHARGEAIGRLKAEGVDYDERMAIVDEITWPEPLADLLVPLFEIYRERHPWLPPDALVPKSIVRHMYERAQTFAEFVSEHEMARSEGLLLRYLSDAYRTLRTTVPAQFVDEELASLIEWLGMTVRHTDSSLIEEWEDLTDPSRRLNPDDAPRPSAPLLLTEQTRVIEVMIRNAMFRRVELIAADDVPGLVALEQATSARSESETEPQMGTAEWDAALEAYYDEYAHVEITADARSPQLLHIEHGPQQWRIRQTILDPDGNRDWVIEAELDVAATNEANEIVLLATRCGDF